MRKYLLVCAFLLNLISELMAQTAGENIFMFLTLPNSARLTSLGGTQISIFDDDLNSVFQNPSLLNPSMSNQLSLSFIDYLSDIKYAYVSYARTITNYGNFGLGVHYIDYGKFQEANVNGDIVGTLNNISDYSINAYYSRSLIDSMLQVGGTIKAIGSEYAYWDAFGFAMDAGITYYNTSQLFSAALVVKNLGTMVNTYYDGADNERLPFEIQLGVTKKLLHAPFRLSILASHLEKPDLTYKSELEEQGQTDLVTGQVQEKSKFSVFGDKLMRHMVFGLEFLPTKNFYINLGYNYRRRVELHIPDKTGAAGISWGFGMKIYKFRISYGRARYHLAAVTNHFTVNVNLSEFSQKY
jgi:opacity protein-like surface antigen